MDNSNTGCRRQKGEKEDCNLDTQIAFNNNGRIMYSGATNQHNTNNDYFNNYRRLEKTTNGSTGVILPGRDDQDMNNDNNPTVANTSNVSEAKTSESIDFNQLFPYSSSCECLSDQVDFLESTDSLSSEFDSNGNSNQYDIESLPSHQLIEQEDGTQNHSSKQAFCCDICKSPYIVDPNRRGNRKKQSKHRPSPRHKFDPESNKTLTLCNACGLAFNRPKKTKKNPKSPPSLEERGDYLRTAQEFTSQLIKKYGDTDADRLSCPSFKKSGCGCLQSYITEQDSDTRAKRLLNLVKQAKVLSSQKCYNDGNTDCMSSSRSKIKVGLGNGHRKSKLFEEFVLRNRKILRDKLKLCERATQRILFYSNNFLHKKLKTDPMKCMRIERKKGKAALGKLQPIKQLPDESCCVDNCVKIAKTHAKLLEEWRERATSGQTAARRVLAEMLTPAGGSRTNCYRFISMVTGCSHSTISRVNEQMKKTGGSREPPQHGLIEWWKKNRSSRKPVKNDNGLRYEDSKNFNVSSWQNHNRITGKESANSSDHKMPSSNERIVSPSYQQNYYPPRRITATGNVASSNHHSQLMPISGLAIDTIVPQDGSKVLSFRPQHNFTSQPDTIGNPIQLNHIQMLQEFTTSIGFSNSEQAHYQDQYVMNQDTFHVGHASNDTMQGRSYIGTNTIPE